MRWINPSIDLLNVGYEIQSFRLLVVLFVGLISSSCSSAQKSSSNSALIGEWVVTAHSASQLMIIPRCKSITSGTVFRFTTDSLTVYPNASTTPCDLFSYKRSVNTMSIIKADMIFLCSYEVKGNRLTVRSSSFFTTDESIIRRHKDNQSSTNPEILVTLTKRL